MTVRATPGVLPIDRPAFVSEWVAVSWPPGFLIESAEKMLYPFLGGPNSEKGLAEFHRLPIFNEYFDELAAGFGLNFIHQLHGFHDAEHPSRFHDVSHFYKGIRIGIGGTIKSPDNGRANQD